MSREYLLVLQRQIARVNTILLVILRLIEAHLIRPKKIVDRPNYDILFFIGELGVDR